MALPDIHESERIRKETVVLYLEDELSGDEERRVAEHISTCEVCNDYLNSLKMVSNSLEIVLESEPVNVPLEFSRQVAAAAESDVSELRASFRWPHAVLTVLALIAILVVLISSLYFGMGSSILEISGQSIAFLGLVGNFLFTAATTLSTVIVTVSSKVLFGSSQAIAAVSVIIAVSFLIFSKHILRLKRS